MLLSGVDESLQHWRDKIGEGNTEIWLKERRRGTSSETYQCLSQFSSLMKCFPLLASVKTNL